MRRGRVGVDVIAVLSLLGTLLVGEYLAGALIAVMLACGRALDAAGVKLLAPPQVEGDQRAKRDIGEVCVGALQPLI